MPDIIHTVKVGDTLPLIAQRYLGNPARYLELFEYNRAQLRSGNPDEIFVGETVFIPLQLTPAQIDQPAAAGSNQVILNHGGKQYFNFETVSIFRSMDTVADMFSLSVTFSDLSKISLRPFGYEQVTVSIDGEILITGRSEVLTLKVIKTGTFLTIVGRSMSGQLIDDSITTRPYEFSGKDLNTISSSLIRPFGLSVSFADNATIGRKFERTTARHGETIFSFLSRLASQRGLFLTSGADGNLLFVRANIDSPAVANIKEGAGNLDGSGATYDGTLRYSDIMVDGQQRGGSGSVQGSARDSLVVESGVNRPLVAQAQNTPEGADLEGVARWERGRRAAMSADIVLPVEGWRTLKGDLWIENTTVILEAPGLFIFQPTKMLIKSVQYTQSESGEMTLLSLIFPKAYTLEDVTVRPWV